MRNYRKYVSCVGAVVVSSMIMACDKEPAEESTISAPEATVMMPAAIKELIVDSESELTLIHVWATWCPPCVVEFPELLRVYDDVKDAGLKLHLVSADDPKDLNLVEQFLKEQGSPLGSVVSQELNEDFIETLSTNWSGALPASFFFDASGTLVGEWEGKRSYEEYMETIHSLLKKQKE